MKPTNKAPAIDAMLSSIFGVDRTATISEGKCVSCDSTGNIATSFHDDISRKEYAISGLCQSCQDDVFGGSDDEDDDCNYETGGPYDEDEDSYSDAEADADTLASAGMGTDEDYGCF
jgi:hypothetical protein